MSLELLLDRFDWMIQTQDDVEKLERVILQLAVQGRLVAQSAKDESVDTLLQKIEEQRQHLVQEGKLVKTKKPRVVQDREVPFTIPTSWRWVRLPTVYYDCGQQKPKRRFTYIDVSSINNVDGVVGNELAVIEPEDAPSRARKLVANGTVIYSTVRPYLLNVAIIDREFDPPPIVSTAFEVMHPHTGIVNRYLFYYLRSQPFVNFVESQMQGMAYPAISKGKLGQGLFPLPPQDEQERIVQKLDEFFGLTRALKERLETNQITRSQLLDAVLARVVNGVEQYHAFAND